MVQEMHTILEEVGIIAKDDPLNLMIVSQGYHKTLHTDSYITELYYALLPARKNRDAVMDVLFWYRLIIAANDPYADNY